MSEPLDLDAVRDFLRQFAAERDWDELHTPKNLAMALAGEAGELLEIFQWLTAEESMLLTDDQRNALADELADLLQYVVRIADIAGIELGPAVWAKLRANEARYAVEDVKGSAAKL